MSISYEPLWLELQKRNMKKKDLKILADISDNLLANMKNCKGISIANLEKICKALEITPNDVLEFKDDLGE